RSYGDWSSDVCSSDLDDRLAVDGVDERLADEPVSERLHAHVEAVEADREHRPFDIALAGSGDRFAVVAMGRRRVLQVAALELLVHGVELLAREDAIDEPRQSRRALEVIRICREHQLAPALPLHEPERPRPHRRRAEGVALLLDDLARHNL